MGQHNTKKYTYIGLDEKYNYLYGGYTEYTVKHKWIKSIPNPIYLKEGIQLIVKQYVT